MNLPRQNNKLEYKYELNGNKNKDIMI
jgi:hypothetical protein